MGHKLATGLVLLLLFAAAGAAFVFLSGDDDATDTAQSTTTTIATSTSTTTPSSTTAATTAPTTTEPPTTTAAAEAVVDACGAEGGAIVAAVNAGIAGARERAQVDQCRLAAADPSWVAVSLVAKPGAEFDEVTVLLQGGGGSWSIIGSGNAACSQAPQQVRVDLGLICSSGGGGGI